MLTAHLDTKILPRLGPTAYGGEVSEGKHLDRTIRWSPQGFERESNSKQQTREKTSKGAPTPITKATGKGRRDIDDTLNAADAQTFRQAAGTGLCMSSEPNVVHQLQVVRVARYILQHPGETWLFGYQADPKILYVYTDTEWAADELTSAPMASPDEPRRLFWALR